MAPSTVHTHTIVAVYGNGRQLASKTIATTTKDHLGLLTWAEQLAEGDILLWAEPVTG